MKIPQCFLFPVFSTSQWQLPFQKENPSGNLATKIVSLAFIVISTLPCPFKTNVEENNYNCLFHSKPDLHRWNELSDLDVYSFVLLSLVVATLNLKLKSPVLNTVVFHILLPLAAAFISAPHCRGSQDWKQRQRFLNPLRRELGLEAETGSSVGTVGITLSSGAVCTASAIFFISDTGMACVHLWDSSFLVSLHAIEERAIQHRLKGVLCPCGLVYGSRIYHFD